MKKIVVVVLVGLVLGSIGVVNVVGYKNIVLIGYVYIDLSGWFFGNVNGVNIKYNWEDLDSGFGVMGLVIYILVDVNNYGYKVGDVDYIFFFVGFLYCFNDYLNVYVMIGVVNGYIKDNWGNFDNKIVFVYGVGIQFNLVENIVVNVFYEYISFFIDVDSDVKVGIQVFGVGYSF